MRHLITFLLTFVCVASSAQDCVLLDELETKWMTRSIKVTSGGEKPDVVQFLAAFDKAWNTCIMDGVLSSAKNPKFIKSGEDEYGGYIIVDRKNGYVCDDAGGSDGASMEACVWRRDNGHRLFAVEIGKPTDPMVDYVCFYDYDPKTHTMKPEERPFVGWQRVSDDSELSYSLPRTGKDFIIKEYTGENDEPYHHVFRWDGMKPVFSYITLNGKIVNPSKITIDNWTE